jgi:hypothetical protein
MSRMILDVSWADVQEDLLIQLAEGCHCTLSQPCAMPPVIYYSSEEFVHLASWTFTIFPEVLEISAGRHPVKNGKI